MSQELFTVTYNSLIEDCGACNLGVYSDKVLAIEVVEEAIATHWSNEPGNFRCEYSEDRDTKKAACFGKDTVEEWSDEETTIITIDRMVLDQKPKQ